MHLLDIQRMDTCHFDLNTKENFELVRVLLTDCLL